MLPRAHYLLQPTNLRDLSKHRAFPPYFTSPPCQPTIHHPHTPHLPALPRLRSPLSYPSITTFSPNQLTCLHLVIYSTTFNFYLTHLQLTLNHTATLIFKKLKSKSKLPLCSLPDLFNEATVHSLHQSSWLKRKMGPGIAVSITGR